MTDTVRTIDELLNSIFASGQAAKSINEQDVRDALVSISLETTDLSSLPRSPAGLAVGRLWIDSAKALRIVTIVQPVNSVDFVPLGGRGGLFAQGIIQGAVTWPGSATIRGSGGLTAAPVVVAKPSGSANLSGSGSVVASTVQRQRASGSLGGGSSIFAPPDVFQQGTGGAFSVDFSAEFDRSPTTPVIRQASATIAGTGGRTANPDAIGNMLWAATANLAVTISGLRVTNNAALGTLAYRATTGTQFKTSGKWYIELFFPTRADDVTYGIANPSINAASYLGADQNSWGIYDQLNGTGTDLYNNVTTYSGTVAPGQQLGVVSIALDCDNWKWWTRLNGGAWSALAGGTQNPATNSGGMSIPANLRTGGVSVAVSIRDGTDFVDMRPASAAWGYIAPSGFTATGTAVPGFAAVPPQAATAGFYRLAMFDDFTSASTITNTTGLSAVQAGVNWYPGFNQSISDPTNYHLLTSTTAAAFSNGNTGGGSNASPSGGVLRIYGHPSVSNQGNLIGVPQNLINGTYQGTNTFGPQGYWEGYVQYNPALGNEHISFWTLCADWANTTELDIMEFAPPLWGQFWVIGNLNQWSGGVDISSQSLNQVTPVDAQWHTMGILVKATSGGQGTFSVYLDNVLKGSITVGTGTNYPTALGPKRFWLLGKDWGAGTGTNSINFDWVRYWSA